ncbi:hypothetical protein TIFTF001_016709 [Ficus carica]|uniref:Uncharacterized protein n=1 Tax=Ficus carica TaxID=3494 RepID=A0AA88APB6_FICCA|nr:hypothetical protein TIFTF001_016709 [Ficus carica]
MAPRSSFIAKSLSKFTIKHKRINQKKPVRSKKSGRGNQMVDGDLGKISRGWGYCLWSVSGCGTRDWSKASSQSKCGKTSGLRSQTRDYSGDWTKNVLVSRVADLAIGSF